MLVWAQIGCSCTMESANATISALSHGGNTGSNPVGDASDAEGIISS